MLQYFRRPHGRPWDVERSEYFDSAQHKDLAIERSYVAGEFFIPTGNESMPKLCTGWRRKLHPAAIRQTNRQSESLLVEISICEIIFFKYFCVICDPCITIILERRLRKCILKIICADLILLHNILSYQNHVLDSLYALCPMHSAQNSTFTVSPSLMSLFITTVPSLVTVTLSLSSTLDTVTSKLQPKART